MIYGVVADGEPVFGRKVHLPNRQKTKMIDRFTCRFAIWNKRYTIFLPFYSRVIIIWQREMTLRKDVLNLLIQQHQHLATI